MNDEVRLLKWNDGVLKFPCGVKVDISEEKIKKLFTMFKVDESLINQLITTGQGTPIPKGKAFQIKSHLT